MNWTKRLPLLWMLVICTSLMMGQQILLVSGDDPGSLNGGDQALYNHFQNTLGLTVTVKGGPNTPVASSDATGKDLVFISSTILSSNVNTTFRDVNVPVIVSESYLLDDMKMTGTITGISYGIANNVSQLTILNSSHPIAQPLSGTIPVTTANTSLRWGNPSSNADEIAKIAGLFNRSALFIYEAGDNMVGLQAPDIRVGFFFDDLTATHPTGNAWTLLDNVVNYILNSATCTADAGTLTIDQNPVTLVGGTATVSATPDGNIHVPSGYSVIYVLTSGSNLVIEQVSSSPSFTVSAAGSYTIHTLVYDGDSNSPNFLDLSVVQPGTTTGGDVLNIVTSNGLCASLDVTGAPVHVQQSCAANAGSLTPDQLLSVLTSNSSTTISATPDGNMQVPAGYSVLYVLTRGLGLTIQDVNTSPSFTVASQGRYRIHTLVYDGDPNSQDFLDLSIVQPGVTTGFDVQQVIDNAGICADLDVQGARTWIIRFYRIRSFFLQFLSGSGRVVIDWEADEPIEGARYIIERSQDGNAFMVLVTIDEIDESMQQKHTFTDESPLEGINHYRLRVVDSRGQTIHKEEASIQAVFEQEIDINVFPNPARSQVTIQRKDYTESVLNIRITDLTGREVIPVSELLMPGASTNLNVSTLPEGLYQIFLTDEQGRRVGVEKLHKR